MKKLLASLLSIALLLTVSISINAETPLAFTLEELQKYNGQNGANAYVAINGIVYDVTANRAWVDGAHKNGVKAGTDATNAIANAPHGEKVLANLPKVGVLVESELSFEELATFNGKDGAKAYVAVNGLVYDVSASPAWENAVHNGVVAGTDATEAIVDAPHGEAILEKLALVAKIKDFSIEELSAFNGKDGNAAYIAVDGLVYDISNNPAWTNGSHNGAIAGTDISESIRKAPHGTVKLDGLTIVGYLK